VVECSTHNLKIKGTNHATGTGREKELLLKKVGKACLDDSIVMESVENTFVSLKGFCTTSYDDLTMVLKVGAR
jgi:hypothetical protein